MKKITIFLASSNELLPEREKFEIEIYRKSRAWSEKGVIFHLDIWEDMSGKMSQTSSQDEYNKRVKSSDLFVILVFTKLGKYTEVEFDNAYFGNIGLQSTFASLVGLSEFSLETLILKLSNGPRSILGLDETEIKEGVSADLTLFDPSRTWRLEKSDICSNTFNSPYVDKELTGFILGVINKGKLALKD